MAHTTAHIIGADGDKLYEVQTGNGGGYSVPGLSAHTKNGKGRAVYGCRDEREALRTAKAVAKLAGKDPAGWRLRLL